MWVISGVLLALHLLVLSTALSLFAEAVVNITPDVIIEIFTGEPERAGPAIVGFTAASSLQVSLLLPIIAAVVAGQEFRGHQLGVSVLAVPDRRRLIAAKTLATAVTLLAIAVVIAAISAAFTYDAVKQWNPGLMTSREMLLAEGRYLAFAVLYGLTGFAISIIGRRALAGIIGSLVLVLITMSQAMTFVSPHLDALFPLSAGRNLLLEGDVNDLTSGRVQALAVLLVWAAAGVAVSGVLLNRRDAR